VLHVYGQPEDPAYLSLQVEFADQNAWFSVRKLGGRTHFAMIETPEEVAAAIDAFVAGR
jgi:hypothetical protein